jgi:hypothetical protein
MSCHTFFCSHKFRKIFFLNVEEKKLRQFSKNLELFTQKIVTKLSDPGSEIRKKPIPDGSKRHRIPDPQHC